MTAAELIERARRQLNAGQAQPHVWLESETDLAACVMQALDELSRVVMADPNLRALMQQEYTLALNAAGEGDLSTATGAIAGDILLDGVRHGVVLDADNNSLRLIPLYFDFLGPQPTLWAYYNLKNGNTIATRAKNVPVNSAADIQSVNGPLRITANFAPASVDDVRPELEGDLVRTLCNIVAQKVTPTNVNT